MNTRFPIISTPIRLLGWLHLLLGGSGIVTFLQRWLEPRTEQTPWFAGPPFLLMGLVGLFLSLLGGTGLLLGWPWARQLMAVLSVVYLLVVPLGTLLGGFGLWVLWASLQGSLRSETEAMEAEMQQRLATLRSDPLRAQYATLIEQGEPWSDEQIAYDLDPGVLNTCPHLGPIEAAMRRVGLRVKPFRDQEVLSPCIIAPERLQKFFTLPPSVGYAEPHHGGAHLGPKSALLYCNACASLIITVHPEQATQGTPVFPE